MKSKLNAILAASAIAFSLAGAAHAEQPSGKMDMKGMNGCCDKMSSMKTTGNADVDFASMMREHHKGALSMA